MELKSNFFQIGNFFTSIDLRLAGQSNRSGDPNNAEVSGNSLSEPTRPWGPGACGEAQGQMNRGALGKRGLEVLGMYAHVVMTLLAFRQLVSG